MRVKKRWWIWFWPLPLVIGFHPKQLPSSTVWAAATPSKAVAKSIRKSIFRLKSMGLAVEEVDDPSPAVFQPPRLAPAEGFLSPIDSSGSRFVLLFQPQIPQGVAVMNTLISDLEGIVDFNALGNISQKLP